MFTFWLGTIHADTWRHKTQLLRKTGTYSANLQYIDEKTQMKTTSSCHSFFHNHVPRVMLECCNDGDGVAWCELWNRESLHTHTHRKLNSFDIFYFQPFVVIVIILSLVQPIYRGYFNASLPPRAPVRCHTTPYTAYPASTVPNPRRLYPPTLPMPHLYPSIHSRYELTTTLHTRILVMVGERAPIFGDKYTRSRESLW